MTINVLRGKVRRGDPNPVAIGEEDANVFSCPSCARPLASGAIRCPGCKTRLVMGIPLGRAGLFIALGVALGTLAGGGVVALTVQDRLATAAAAIQPVDKPVVNAPAIDTPAVDGGSTTTQPGGQAPAAPAIPAAAVWSLTQSALINARLAEASAQLHQALGAGSVDSAIVAAALRTIASDAASGADLSVRLGGWSAAAGLAADLRSFYADARGVARGGLAASPSNEPAYRQAAIDMVGVLGSLTTLDARSRTLADTAGVTLAPVALPFATDAVGPTGPGPEPLP